MFQCVNIDMRKRTSVIWGCSDEQFKTWVEESDSMSQLLRRFGLENKGGNFVTCKHRIRELGLDVSRYLNRLASSKRSLSLSKEEFLSKLTEHSFYNRGSIKKHLLKFGLLEYQCSKCHNVGLWQNEKLSLHLEHKNGISNDHRFENLEFLCPNCH